MDDGVGAEVMVGLDVGVGVGACVGSAPGLVVGIAVGVRTGLPQAIVAIRIASVAELNALRVAIVGSR